MIIAIKIAIFMIILIIGRLCILQIIQPMADGWDRGKQQ